MEDGFIGKRFNRWVVVNRWEDYIYPSTGKSSIRYNCLCDCGNTKLVHKSHLLNGSSQSCSCIKKGITPPITKANDLAGHRFGRLLVLNREGSFTSTKGSIRVKWKCICDCGNYAYSHSNSLKTGNTSSCGCLGIESRITHNMYNTRPYYIWASMRSRCDAVDKEYNKRYGGRGITYQDSWKDFDVFWSDMKDNYDDHLTLDRKDTNANYCKANCRWTDKKTQAFNANMHCTNTSGRTGVYESEGLFYARVKVNDEWRSTTKGSFDKALADREAYEIAEYGYLKPYEKL